MSKPVYVFDRYLTTAHGRKLMAEGFTVTGCSTFEESDKLLRSVADDGEDYVLRSIENEGARLATAEAERDALIAGQSTLYGKIEEAAADVRRLEQERDAAQASALEWERKAMDVENHPVVKALIAERDKAERLNEFFRSSVGECHLMISRQTSEYQLDKKDWDATTLPARVSSLMKQLLTAQPGEARAVEALEGLMALFEKIWPAVQAANDAGLMNVTPHFPELEEFIFVKKSRSVLSSAQPALAWLAQRDADLLKGLYDEWLADESDQGSALDDFRRFILRKAAALRAGATGGSDAG